MRDDDLPAVIACYDRVASTLDGAIARSEAWWRRRILAARPPTPREDPGIYAFVSRSGEHVRGSIVYTLLDAGADAYGMRVVCRDLVWEDEASASALLALVAGGRPIVTTVEWPGALVDPLAQLMGTAPRVVESTPWMHRVVDPVRAIALRGFSAAVRAELAFHVRDVSEPDWSTGLRVRIADGRAEVAQDGTQRPELDVGTLSAILAGSLHPRTAARLGRLRADPVQLDDLGTLVPSGQRWIGDRF
jgi:predicted acetyltransferase